MLRRGEDRSDYARLDAMTEAELEASIDPKDEGGPGWTTAMPDFPGPHQRQLAVRFDRDVVAWFEAQGGDYLARMNAVLREYIEAQTRSRPGPATPRSSAPIDPGLSCCPEDDG